MHAFDLVCEQVREHPQRVLAVLEVPLDDSYLLLEKVGVLLVLKEVLYLIHGCLAVLAGTVFNVHRIPVFCIEGVV